MARTMVETSPCWASLKISDVRNSFLADVAATATVRCDQMKI